MLIAGANSPKKIDEQILLVTDTAHMPAKFTIIITTYRSVTNERHDVLLRSIDYYKHFNCNVVIADSSARKFDYEFPNNVTYKHLPGLGYGKKMFEVAKDVVTPYVCLSADDDYLLESSLQVGARFLDDNLDYASVQGRHLNFELIGNQVIFNSKYSRQISHIAITSEDRFSRIVRAYNPYMWHLYSIHRTDLFIKSVQLCADISTYSNTDRFTCQITEFIQPLVPMCYGKHRVLPILWLVRDNYVFDSDRRKIDLTEQQKVNSAAHNYKSINRFVNNVKKFLGSEECSLTRKKFGLIIFELVNNNKESNKLFDAAFKSLIKDLTNNRNKIIVKLIIKLVIPTWVLKYYTKRKTSRHMGGVETTASAKDALNKIRLSVLTFRKCYDR